MKNGKRATIKDVAALAGVSLATVSRVLSNANYPVSTELRAQVEAAAKQLSFAYTTAPRQGKNSSGREIALLVPNMSNPYYMQTIQGIGSVCYEQEYQLVLCNSQWDEAKELGYLQDLYARKITGLIISSVSDSTSALDGYIDKGMVIVQLDQRFENAGCLNINFDSRLGARLAVRHLIENGHKRIAFASTPLTRWTRKEIYKGYTEQLKRAEIELDETLVFISEAGHMADWDNYEVLAGQDIARQLAESGCGATAAFCVNDMLAFGMIHGLDERGIAVPRDLSVVGFDDIPFTEFFVPPLTTVHCPSYETGRLAAMMLIDRLQNQDTAVAQLNMNMQSTLVERQSVRNLNEG